MDPEIIKEAMRQVLGEMGGAARSGLANKFMGGAKPVASAGLDEAPAEELAVSPLGEESAMAADAADAGGEEADEPSDEELEEMLKASK